MFENLSSKQKKFIIAIGVLVCVGVIYYIYNNISNKNSAEEYDEIMVQNTQNSTAESTTKNEEEYIVIHITGAVKTPGTVRLKENARIEDAIEKAGGLTEDADISKVNLAYVLDDGMKITIPKIENVEEDSNEDEDVISNDSGENVIKETEESENKTSEININKANQTELETLPGIGASLASRIVTYREENGKFSNIDEIKNVSGIGDSKFENIKDLICVK